MVAGSSRENKNIYIYIYIYIFLMLIETRSSSSYADTVLTELSLLLAVGGGRDYTDICY